MALYEGPAPHSQTAAGVASITQSVALGASDLPSLTPERLHQELVKLGEVIAATEKLNFLEPRVKRCISSGQSDTPSLIAFYRIVSQSLAEEVAEQKEHIRASQSALVQAKQSSAQQQMRAALEEASQAVQIVSARTESGGQSKATASSAYAPTDGESSDKLEKAEKQIERLMLDMQNMRNRAQTDIDIRVFKELEKFSLSLLPALDAFHQAMSSMGKASDVQSLVTGVGMIYEQLLESLEQAGLKRLKTIGERFDPRFHEAIGNIDSDELPDDHIFDELQPGYSLGERLIRAAMVRVARNPNKPGPDPVAATAEEAAPSAASSPPDAQPLAQNLAPAAAGTELGPENNLVANKEV